MRWGVAVWAICTSFATGAAAQEAPEAPNGFVTYSMDVTERKVVGAMTVARLVDGNVEPQGYSLRQVVDFITEDCASGKVGPVKLGKKRLKKRDGIVRQKFRTSCIGGPHPSIGATGIAKITIERQEDGRDLAEYYYSQNGDMLTSERYR